MRSKIAAVEQDDEFNNWIDDATGGRVGMENMMNKEIHHSARPEVVR
jgi:hypothetical protein